jgi:hypothetical protein
VYHPVKAMGSGEFLQVWGPGPHGYSVPSAKFCCQLKTALKIGKKLAIHKLGTQITNGRMILGFS